MLYLSLPMLSFDMLSLDMLSLDMESFDIVSLDIVSFFIVSFFMVSVLLMLSFDMSSAKAAGTKASAKPTVAAASDRMGREVFIAWSSLRGSVALSGATPSNSRRAGPRLHRLGGMPAENLAGQRATHRNHNCDRRG